MESAFNRRPADGSWNTRGVALCEPSSESAWPGRLARWHATAWRAWFRAARRERVRAEGLAGATVVRGIQGFGADSRRHTSRLLRLSEDLPVVIEIVDTEEQIARVLPLLDEMVQEGMVTPERVQIIAYRGSEPRGPAPK